MNKLSGVPFRDDAIQKGDHVNFTLQDVRLDHFALACSRCYCHGEPQILNDAIGKIRSAAHRSAKRKYQTQIYDLKEKIKNLEAQIKLLSPEVQTQEPILKVDVAKPV